MEPETLTVCVICEDETDDANQIDGADYCTDCSTTCNGCGSTIEKNAVDTLRTFYSGHYCSDCWFHCGGCGCRTPEDEEIALGDGARACGDCSQYCDNCGEYFWSEEERCEYCSAGDGTLMGYRTTYPSVWLGGPLPRDAKDRQVGYYLGIELEIGTSELTARNVESWAARTLGVANAFECKEDSTVDGFEIASQPMTPEYFESVDWDSFFRMLNEDHPLDYGPEESEHHGLHVHVGRVAFRDDLTLAAWAYLIGQGNHLERIGRREPTEYCRKVRRPASAAIVSRKGYRSIQGQRLSQFGAGRDAINFQGSPTVEVRAFRSTRSANELRDAVRLVYLTVDYIRALRPDRYVTLPKDALHWHRFAEWVRVNRPEAYTSIAGIPSKPKSNRIKTMSTSTQHSSQG